MGRLGGHRRGGRPGGCPGRCPQIGRLGGHRRGGRPGGCPSRCPQMGRPGGCRWRAGSGGRRGGLARRRCASQFHLLGNGRQNPNHIRDGCRFPGFARAGRAVAPLPGGGTLGLGMGDDLTGPPQQPPLQVPAASIARIRGRRCGGSDLRQNAVGRSMLLLGRRLLLGGLLPVVVSGSLEKVSHWDARLLFPYPPGERTGVLQT